MIQNICQSDDDIIRAFNKYISSGEFPEIVYKFCEWGDTPRDNILKKQQIRLSSPRELMADYQETILPIDESYLIKEELDRVALDHASKIHSNLPLEIQRIMAEHYRKKMTILDPKIRAQSMLNYIEKNDQTLGVFCSSYTFEDFKQWERMADLGKGFAVGLDLQKIYLNKKIQGWARRVEYYPANRTPTVAPYSFTDEEAINNSAKEMFSIPDTFSYEKEFRIVRRNHRYDKNNNIAAYNEEERLVTIDTDCYREIILGYNISKSDKKAIQLERDKINKSVPIFETKIETNKVYRHNKL